MSDQVDYGDPQALQTYVSGLRHLSDIPAWRQLELGLQNEMRIVMEQLDRENDPYAVMALKGKLSAYRAMTTWRERTVKTIDELIARMSKEKHNVR